MNMTEGGNPPRAMYKADDRIREVERDVAKRWVTNNIRIACIDLENQTKADPYISLRVMGYDGVDYRTQLRDLKNGKKPCPVVTLVLYFGYKGHWNAPLSLLEALDVPEILKPYVTDVKVSGFVLAFNPVFPDSPIKRRLPHPAALRGFPERVFFSQIFTISGKSSVALISGRLQR